MPAEVRFRGDAMGFPLARARSTRVHGREAAREGEGEARHRLSSILHNFGSNSTGVSCVTRGGVREREDKEGEREREREREERL